MSDESSSHGMHVREYRHGDFPGIINVWSLTGMGDPLRGDNEIIIENSIAMGGNLLVLEDNDTGTVAGTSWMTFDGRRVLLHHFGILPEYQGKGYSHMLIEQSLRFVKEKGYQVKLEVHSANQRAISLYKKYGFKSLGDYGIYIIRDLSKINT